MARYLTFSEQERSLLRVWMLRTEEKTSAAFVGGIRGSHLWLPCSRRERICAGRRKSHFQRRTFGMSSNMNIVLPAHSNRSSVYSRKCEKLDICLLGRQYFFAHMSSILCKWHAVISARDFSPAVSRKVSISRLCAES